MVPMSLYSHVTVFYNSSVYSKGEVFTDGIYTFTPLIEGTYEFRVDPGRYYPIGGEADFTLDANGSYAGPIWDELKMLRTPQ